MAPLGENAVAAKVLSPQISGNRSSEYTAVLHRNKISTGLRYSQFLAINALLCAELLLEKAGCLRRGSPSLGRKRQSHGGKRNNPLPGMNVTTLRASDNIAVFRGRHKNCDLHGNCIKIHQIQWLHNIEA